MNKAEKKLAEILMEYAYELAADYIDAEHEELNETQRDDAIQELVSNMCDY